MNSDELIALLKKQEELLVEENIQGYNDRNKRWEEIAMQVLNIAYDWNLESMNKYRSNFPAIDLGDQNIGIGVQISTDFTPGKVRHSLEKMSSTGIGRPVMDDFPNLYFFFLSFEFGSTKSYSYDIPDGVTFTTNHILNFTTFMDRFVELSEEKQNAILQFLYKELTEIPTPQADFNHIGSYQGNSRLKELEEIDAAFQEHKEVYLWGLGGIGKTELAIEWGLRKKEQKKTVFLFHYNKNITDSLLRADFRGLDPANKLLLEIQSKSEKEYRKKELFKERLDIIRKHFPDAIIIIDNFDDANRPLSYLQNEEDFKLFRTLPNKILFTTRSRVVKDGIQVTELAEEHLLGLIESHYPPLKKESESITSDCTLANAFRKIIHEVEGHTLTLELISKTLAKSFGTISPDQFLESFQKRKVDKMFIPKVQAAHRSFQSDAGYEKKQERLLTHLTILYDMADLSEVSKNVLQYAMLLTVSGIPVDLFLNCLDWDERDEFFDTLLTRSWLRLSENQPHMISMHPMILLALENKMDLIDETCQKFLYSLKKTVSSNKASIDVVKPAADVLYNACRLLSDTEGELNHSAGLFLRQKGFYEDAAELLESAVERKQKTNGEAVLINRWRSELGKTRTEQREFEQAVRIQRECLDDALSREAATDELCRIYNDLSIACGKHAETTRDRNLFDEAIQCLQKVNELQSMENSDLSVYRATNIHNLGNLYAKKGKTFRGKVEKEYYWKALSCHQDALEIRETIAQVYPGKYDKYLSISYKNVGNDYANLSDNKSALIYRLKALEISKKVYPEFHPEVARLTNMVAHSYRMLKNYDSAEEYHQNAIQIWRNLLPSQQAELAQTLYDLSICYLDSIRENDEPFDKRNKYQRAEDNARQACESYKQVKKPVIQSSGMIQSYELIAQIYTKQYKKANDRTEHEEKIQYLSVAVEYQRKAWEIQKHIKPQGRDQRMRYMNLINSLSENAFLLKDYSLAVEFFSALKENIEIYGQKKDYHRKVNTRFRLALSYKGLHDYENALINFKEALEIKNQYLPDSLDWRNKIDKEIQLTQNSLEKSLCRKQSNNTKIRVDHDHNGHMNTE